MPDPELDQLRLELRSLRVKVSEARQYLQDTEKFFDTVIRSFESIRVHALNLQEVIATNFLALTGVDPLQAELLIPAGMATNAKKAVKRWPDPIQQNATKALSTGRKPAKPAAH
ncbi:MAG TPA: hypothetical protein VMU45_08685 [Candidatus Eisenbacteria bacterium]|nr:hypothetical protein [Candidatus Eisenbacteria bacterium]